MDSHFLTDIDIIDFKCFQNFSAKGFKRVNLIGGKNNIGKTAFMEACYVNVTGKNNNYLILAIIDIKFMREKNNILAKSLSGIAHKNLMRSFLDSTQLYKVKSNLKTQEYRRYIPPSINAKAQYIIDLDRGEKTTIKEDDLNIEHIEKQNYGNINISQFIDNFGLTELKLAKAFSVIQLHEKEDKLNTLISEFDERITKFKLIENIPMCKINNNYRELTECGDGLKHYISIICSLYACQNGYLFIDEIDNGIYFEQFDRLWEIILTISKEANCQVFATTHSKEMIESFARVSQKLNEQDISYTTLVKNDKHEVKALVQNYGMFMYSMNFEHEVR